MVWRMILPAVAALAFASGAAWAQASKDEDPSQNMPQKLRERLAADGYPDVKIAPGSYVVSAKDKDGKRVVDDDRADLDDHDEGPRQSVEGASARHQGRDHPAIAPEPAMARPLLLTALAAVALAMVAFPARGQDRSRCDGDRRRAVDAGQDPREAERRRLQGHHHPADHLRGERDRQERQAGPAADRPDFVDRRSRQAPSTARARPGKNEFMQQ